MPFSFRVFKWAAVAALMVLSAPASFADTVYILNGSDRAVCDTGGCTGPGCGTVTVTNPTANQYTFTVDLNTFYYCALASR
jgi:hypothetical protein